MSHPTAETLQTFLDTFFPITKSEEPSTQYEALKSNYYVLSTKYEELSTKYEELSTQYSALSLAYRRTKSLCDKIMSALKDLQSIPLEHASTIARKAITKKAK